MRFVRPGCCLFGACGTVRGIVGWLQRWPKRGPELKRRYDLIPNLVEVARKSMQDEAVTLEERQAFKVQIRRTGG